MTLLRFIQLCIRAWRVLQQDQIALLSVTKPGMPPTLVMFVARDREAWRITQFALDVNFANPGKQVTSW